MKHVVAYIFLLIFSFQALPVQQLSKALFKKCVSVEECDCMGMETDADDSAEQDIKKETDPYRFIATQEYCAVVYLAQTINIAIQATEHLPTAFTPDIATPPPNSLA